ncbi:ATP-binding protein [Nocardia sp. CA2R105]|uniref:ATP-binding protein n=1 Tax=Nocardia coffeae TaxID=2873381 RepID=UPI001CA74DDE|nr:ATP-binding protein [Nocardia coffeae]MBY8862098.1 ATP-binding protein [Nocardia coffeae]
MRCDPNEPANESADPLELNFPAVAGELADVRHSVRGWLERRSVTTDRALDILLAVDEVCANAIEHGHRDDGGFVSLTARVEGDHVRIVVADHGRWKPQGAAADPIRGRGLAIVRTLIPRVVITTGDGGTVVDMRAPIRTGSAAGIPLGSGPAHGPGRAGPAQT